jgi:hypothetical protein
MELRSVKQIKIYSLILNTIFEPVKDNGVLMPHISYSFNDMEKFINSEMAEDFWVDNVDGAKFHKRFNKGSDLEECIYPIEIIYEEGDFRSGIKSQWIEEKDLKTLIMNGEVLEVGFEKLKKSSRDNVLVDQSDKQDKENKQG